MCIRQTGLSPHFTKAALAMLPTLQAVFPNKHHPERFQLAMDLAVNDYGQRTPKTGTAGTPTVDGGLARRLQEYAHLQPEDSYKAAEELGALGIRDLQFEPAGIH